MCHRELFLLASYAGIPDCFCYEHSIPPCALCSVGIKPPGIEVRFKDIFIETSVFTNVSRNLPSVLNAYRGGVEVGSRSMIVLRCLRSSALVMLSRWKSG